MNEIVMKFAAVFVRLERLWVAVSVSVYQESSGVWRVCYPVSPSLPRRAAIIVIVKLVLPSMCDRGVSKGLPAELARVGTW